MTHPFAKHAEHKKSHERVGKILKEYADGGKVIGGDATAGNIADTNSYARGGRLPTAGARSGVGRLQKADK